MVTYITRYWKYILVFVVLFTSWISFIQTDMVGIDNSYRYVQALYYSIVIFILGGIDIGVPRGGSNTVINILWICYFFAPLLTASFVYQVVQERILSRLSPLLRGHTIICGLGRNGKLIYDLVKEYAPKRHKIVIIEKNSQNAYSELLEKDPATWWLKNDFTSLAILRKAKIHNASHIILTTNRDLQNLNTIFGVNELEKTKKDVKLSCHLGDLNLHGNLKTTLLNEEKFANLKLFNGYHCVTRRLYKNWIVKPGYLSSDGNIFIILGFGRFGRMLYSHLIADMSRTHQDEIIIVTLKTSYEVDQLQYNWAKQDVTTQCKIHPSLKMDVHDPALWEKLAKIVAKTQKQVHIFVCMDNDIGNLDVAISMKRNGPEQLKRATFFCRIFSQTAREINEILERRITETQSKDIVLFPLQKELKEAFREELFV